ncbi:hypothetical protein ACS0PU_001407 [Formica fusca]
MVIHHHRRRYVNKLDLSFVAGRGAHEEVRWELYRRKEGQRERRRERERGKKRAIKKWKKGRSGEGKR